MVTRGDHYHIVNGSLEEKRTSNVASSNASVFYCVLYISAHLILPAYCDKNVM